MPDINLIGLKRLISNRSTPISFATCSRSFFIKKSFITSSSSSQPEAYIEPNLTQTYHIPQAGKIKVSLESQSALGIAQSRGERPYQEDYFTLSSLNIKHSEIQKTIKKAENYQKLIGNKKAGRRTTNQVDDDQLTLQSLFVGAIDGHGGTDSAEYLSKNLPRMIQGCRVTEIPDVIRDYRSIGGYFRRFRGGFLQDLAQEAYEALKLNENKQPAEEDQSINMGVDERLSLGFLLADQHLIKSYPKSGAVMTAALLTSLPVETDQSSSPSSSVIYPYFGSPLLSLVIAHVGDTSGLLCSARDGKVTLLTENHHPDSRVESERLRRIGTGLITDSFGESRWGGSLANSRGLGDASFKAMGVTGEPDIINKILVGNEWEFLILVSDGISNVITNQEIVDLCKGHKSPTEAASNVVRFAESLGGRDNMTAIVVPLMGWRRTGSPDLTSERREFRLKHLTSSAGSGRQRRM